MQLSTKHLLGIRDLQPGDIQLILDTATQFKEVLQRPIKKVPTLRDVTIVNLFYENSTRTRISFELAEKRLSADTINFTASGSSAAKGETLLDTVNNILSMKVDMVVMQHSASGAPHFLARHIPAAIVNAGDGISSPYVSRDGSRLYYSSNRVRGLYKRDRNHALDYGGLLKELQNPLNGTGNILMMHVHLPSAT